MGREHGMLSLVSHSEPLREGEIAERVNNPSPCHSFHFKPRVTNSEILLEAFLSGSLQNQNERKKETHQMEEYI